MDKYIIFHIEGGAGKNVMATAVIRAINKHYPERKIIIITAYPDIWELNPRVWRIYQFGQTQYFYRDFIENKDSIIFAHDPYRENNAIYRKLHLVETWCNMYNIPYDGEKPELYFTQLENDFVQQLLNKNKPIFLINPFGGSPNQQNKYSWARDIPPSLAQEIVDLASKDYRVIQVRREDQLPLNNCESLSLSLRELTLALLHSDKRLLIDSYLQHASAALGLSSTVLWIGNSPLVFGYGLHNNISAKFEEASLRNSLYDPYDIMGSPIQLATPPNFLFNKDEILIDLGLKNKNTNE